jgi:hypothetical protein
MLKGVYRVFSGLDIYFAGLLEEKRMYYNPAL